MVEIESNSTTDCMDIICQRDIFSHSRRFTLKPDWPDKRNEKSFAEH